MNTKCEGCKKPMDMTQGGRRCNACRQKKSRDKRRAIPRAYEMGFEIDGWATMLRDKTIDTETARVLLDAVWDRVYEFYEQIKAAEAVARAKEEEKEAREKRKRR